MVEAKIDRAIGDLAIEWQAWPDRKDRFWVSLRLPRGLLGVLEENSPAATNGQRSGAATLRCGRRRDTHHDVSILFRPFDAVRRAPARPNV
jgi:hypothetical protein